MKIKILPILLTITFLIIFFIFYKGLQNSNIYTPKTDVEKNIPSFSAKLLDDDNWISSDDIFENDKFYLMNIWASWCVPCKDEHPFLMSLSKNEKIKIIETLWRIVYSNNSADMYETNLMRRLAGLLYVDSKVMGDIKDKIQKENL